MAVQRTRPFRGPGPFCFMNANASENKFSTKILVVDDERLIRMTMCAKLRRAGYDPVPASTVDEAVAAVKQNHNAFCAIISDIMMGDMDGFMFRSIVRGIDSSIPFFFITALDPEEGSGFLKSIVADPMSFYLPKAVGADMLVTRVQRIVASRRVEQFIVNQIEETNRSLKLAAFVQHGMLPVRAWMTPSGFFSTWWRPMEIVSGDLFETVPFGDDEALFVLGDVQGHGTSAALVMTAVQSALKRLCRQDMQHPPRPLDIANSLQAFFRADLANVSYMTALICLHDARKNTVRWISCGAPDLQVFTKDGKLDVNPEKRGGLPIGLFPDTVYKEEDEVFTELPRPAVCVAMTDGLADNRRDDGLQLPADDLDEIIGELAVPSLLDGSVSALTFKIVTAVEEAGFRRFGDDVTLMCFGTRCTDGDEMFETTIRLSPRAIDGAAQEIGAWCAKAGWSGVASEKLQLVLEEKIMNIYDHGFDERERVRHVAPIRLRRRGPNAELTVWDCGTPEPSMAVAAGDADTTFELLNRGMSGHGRGRLMLRKMCNGISRNRYGSLNETIYYIPLEDEGAEEAPQPGETK